MAEQQRRPHSKAVVSPATRARQTWDLAAAQPHATPPTMIDDRV
jgi:phosphohistidine phosphatase SixA